MCGVIKPIRLRTRHPEAQNSSVSDGSTTSKSAAGTPREMATEVTSPCKGDWRAKAAAAPISPEGTV
jgi:hypothetical protein